ncbi:diguanylate cyclase [Desulfovibrio aminophilus]|uniref:diguanylate cyclase domain-containing protein n=1 Tax=Desulfovibrio aminophilus TaxID=81425 RepID=UPI003395CA57
MSDHPLEILIVDDTPMNLVVLEHMLKRGDIAIRTAQDGQQALEMVAAHDFALILLDVQMPGLNGYDTARAIKESPRGAGVPIIFVTSIFQDPENVRRGYEVGAVDYLFRPVDAQMLRSKVNVFIDLHRQKALLEAEIAQRRRTEEALRRAEEKYRTIFERAVEGIFQCDMEGTFLEVNPATARLLGYDTPSELVGRPGMGLDILVDNEERRAYLENLLRDGVVANREYQIRRSDGEHLWVSESSRLVEGPDGERLIEGVLEDTTESKKSALDLHYRATYDGLTNIPNRLLFFDRLEHALARAKRYGYGLAVLFLDLDGFKSVNDNFGHRAGDELLLQTAGRLRRRVRASDTLARLGGDEFGVLLERVTELDSVTQAAENVITALAEPFRIGAAEFHIGVSVGVSLFPGDAEDASSLVSRADAAMYAAKKGGGNRPAFAGSIPC